VLRRLVWEPVRRHLGDVKAVLIAPDAELADLPFAALPGQKAGSWLLEEMAIGYLTSGRQLLDQQAISRTPSAGLLAVGGLDFGKPSAKDRGRFRSWLPLPGTASDARTVTALFKARFPAEACCLEEKANRLALVEALGGGGRCPWRYLHLATHGFFEPRSERLLPGQNESGRGLVEDRQTRTFERNPLLSAGLVLAGANESEERGLLTAEEIAGLDLRGCELAVLSACETALGKQVGWQGIQGLQRAFQQAGSRTLIASLWSVSDPATSVLMEQMYQQLWAAKQLTVLEALRQAQLYVLHHPQAVLARAKQLRAELVKDGVKEEELALRGLGQKALQLPAGGKSEGARSPVAWWAPWVLTGVADQPNRERFSR
jgi:CHAT domain-containing protein